MCTRQHILYQTSWIAHTLTTPSSQQNVHYVWLIMLKINFKMIIYCHGKLSYLEVDVLQNMHSPILSTQLTKHYIALPNLDTQLKWEPMNQNHRVP